MNKVIKVNKIFKAEVKSIDLEKKRAVVVISTAKTDRDGDVILPDSFRENLKYYNAHPILLANHDYYSLMSNIGKAHKITINDKDVEADFEWFAGRVNDKGESVNPQADWAWFLAQEGIAAFSIGFKGLEYSWIEEKDQASGQKYIVGRKFTKIELLEVSQVVVPCNAGALQNSLDNEHVSVEAKEIAEFVLKGFNEGNKKYQEKLAPQTKDDNLNVSQLETRLTTVEKNYAELKQQHEDLCGRMETMEQSSHVEDNPSDPKSGNMHYSKDLLAADAKEHKQTADNSDFSSDIQAVKDAFKN